MRQLTGKTGRWKWARSRVDWRQATPILLILAIAFLLRIWGIEFGLPYRYHIDEAPYVVAALKMGSGDLFIDYPYNSPNIYQIMLVIEYGILYVLGSLAGYFSSPLDMANLYESDPTIFFILARLTTAFAGVITVYFVYLIGKRIRGRVMGLLGALFLAFSYIHVRDSHYAVTDTLVTLLTTIAVYGSIAYFQLEQKRYLLLAGLAGGMATGLKYLPASILVAAGLAVILRSRTSGIQTLFREGFLLVAAALAGFFIAFPALLIDPALFQLHLNQSLNQAASALGSFRVDAVSGWIYYLKVLNWGMGLPMLMTALAGILTAAGRNRWSFQLLVTAVLGYYLGISVVDTFFARYALPLVPLLAVCAALFAIEAKEFFEERYHSVATIPGRYFFAAIGVALIILPATLVVRHNILLTRTDTRTQAKWWIEQNIPPMSQVVLQWFGPPLATPADPEPDSNRQYEVYSLSPFMLAAENYELTTYRERGAEYIVVNDFNQQLVHADDRQNSLRANFYAELEREADLVAEFIPYPGEQEPDFFWEQLSGPANDLFIIEEPGPTIRIYGIR